jgi:hypothetical protein
MKRFNLRDAMTAAFGVILLGGVTTALAGNWPGWRGPTGTGYTDETRVRGSGVLAAS